MSAGVLVGRDRRSSAGATEAAAGTKFPTCKGTSTRRRAAVGALLLPPLLLLLLLQGTQHASALPNVIIFNAEGMDVMDIWEDIAPAGGYNVVMRKKLFGSPPSKRTRSHHSGH